MPTAEELHLSSVIAEVPLSKMGIDRSYQRQPSQSLVEDIAANWDIVASELVLVSDRGVRPEDGEVRGGLWLVNGQHRSLAARKLGHETIWARVVDLSGEEDPAAVEAALRLKLNVKLGDRPLERFKAQLRAGDEDSLKIVSILARFGTHINESPDVNVGINAVSTVEALMGQDPTGALLSETLEVLRDSFPALAGRVVSASMLKGLAWFIEQHSEAVDRNRVVTKLREAGTEMIHRRAVTNQSTMGGASWMNYYRAIVDLYNDSLRVSSRLEWQLRRANSFAARSKVGKVSSSSSGGGQTSPGKQGWPS